MTKECVRIVELMRYAVSDIICRNDFLESSAGDHKKSGRDRMSYHVAVVEDDPDTLENYIDVLSEEGYEVSSYTNTRDAIIGLGKQTPDLTILDVHLNDRPDGGFEVHQKLNSLFSEKPTIFISGRDSEADRITGLKMGAWDFVGKPVGVRYLAERVRSLIKISEHRSTKPIEVIPYSEIGLRVNESSLTIHWYGNRVDLTMTEFSIISLIASQPGRVRSYDELKSATRQRLVETNTINGHIRRIRKKFKTIDPAFKALKNVHGVGYKWLASTG